MTEFEWGPVAGLVEQLQRAAPFTARSTDLNRVTLDLGGPWDIYAQGSEVASRDRRLWPESLPSRRKVIATRVAIASGELDLFDRLVSAMKDGDYFQCRPQRIDRSQMAGVLADCHIWLTKKALGYLPPVFAPFSSDAPGWLVAVSQKALMWSVYVFALEHWGPGAALMLAPALRSYSRDASARPGDAVILHMHIERLVQAAAKRFKLNLPDSTARRPAGGLRKSSFIASYLALKSRQSSARSADWLRAIEVLIHASPLTRLLYLDLFEDAQGGDLRPLISDSKGQDWGGDFWMSQIARSLIGALLSPPPVQERLDQAERELVEIEARAKIWASGGLFFSRSIEKYRGLSQARGLCADLRKKSIDQQVQRVTDLRAILECSLHLHLKVLDMLVRHIVTASMSNMLIEWKKAARRREYSRPANLLIDERGACFRSFEQILFGQRLEDLCTVILSDKDRNKGSAKVNVLRECVKSILDPHSDLEPEVLAREAGVPERSARRLLNRFRDETICGIELPFEPPDNRGYSPAQVITDWFWHMRTHFPDQTVVRGSAA